jgi:hypothetical protein
MIWAVTPDYVPCDATERQLLARSRSKSTSALTLQCDLDALVVHLLEFIAERIPPVGAAREKLDDMCDRRAVLPIERPDLRR